MDGSIPLVFMSKSGLSRAICIIWDVEDLPVVMVIAIRWSSGVILGLRRDLKGKEEIANGINNVISIHFHQIKISTRFNSCLLFLFWWNEFIARTVCEISYTLTHSSPLRGWIQLGRILMTSVGGTCGRRGSYSLWFWGKGFWKVRW